MNELNRLLNYVELHENWALERFKFLQTIVTTNSHGDQYLKPDNPFVSIVTAAEFEFHNASVFSGRSREQK